MKLKWVDTIVGRCQETALIKMPDGLRSLPSEMASASPLEKGSASAAGEAVTTQKATLPRLERVPKVFSEWELEESAAGTRRTPKRLRRETGTAPVLREALWSAARPSRRFPPAPRLARAGKFFWQLL